LPLKKAKNEPVALEGRGTEPKKVLSGGLMPEQTGFKAENVPIWRLKGCLVPGIKAEKI